MDKQQKEYYKTLDLTGKITMLALDLAKSHTRWKMGAGSVHSFSKEKDKFVRAINDILYEI
jgi:hypothetical protein